ncbi:MAG: hypothetical protein WBP82_05705 [Leuconostoc mesenteroides]
MTIDEAVINIDNSYDYNVDKYTVIDILENLREEYAPAMFMTKSDKDMLLKYRKDGYFLNFISYVHFLKSETFGVPATDNFKNLSDDDLMKAWLHPETIKVIDE